MHALGLFIVAALFAVVASMPSITVAAGYNTFIAEATAKAGSDAAFAAKVLDNYEGWPLDTIVAALTLVPSADAVEYLEAQEEDIRNGGDPDEEDDTD